MGVILIRFQASGTFMGCVVVVSVCYMSGGADAVNMFHYCSSLCSVRLYNHLKVVPIDTMKRCGIPLESTLYVFIIG